MKLKQPDIKGFNSKIKIEEKSKPTPMIRQYLEVKGRHSDYLLFYRMGDFYELFFDDAKIASAELGIALTKRGKLEDKDIPMCGVPAHSSQTYLSRLINLGYKVAVAEQLNEEEDNQVSKKNQKIFKRDVVRIITPGTILDDALLKSKSNNHLLSIYFLKGEYSVSWVDMSIGVIKVQHINGRNSLNQLYELINKIEPEEIIISDRFEKTHLYDSKFNQFEKKFTKVDLGFFDPGNNKLKVKSFFNKYFLHSLGKLNDVDVGAIGAVINYLELTQKKNIPLINDFEIINDNKFMQIDNFSVRSLELFETIDGHKKGSLLSVIDKTKTASGGRLLRDFLKFPLMNINEIKLRHSIVDEFLKNSMIMTKIIDLLSGHPDVERAISRISARTNNPRDLILVKNFIENSEKIFSEIAYLKYSIKDHLLPDSICLQKLTKLKDYILKNLVELPPINLNDGGIFKKGVNERLDYLRNIRSDKQKEILDMQEEYVKVTKISNLKIKFNNIHGYFVEVTNKNSNKIVNLQESKFSLIQNTINNSRFQTEELKRASNEIQNAQENAINLEKNLYDEMCNKIKELSSDLSCVSKKISFVDVMTSFSSTALSKNYSKPKLINQSLIDLKNCRHPVVEDSLLYNSEEFTANDCLMNYKSYTWLMTGPNMAGKSTFLRQIAIVIILNQVGSFVPAESATLGIFDKIFTRIGASDNLSKGMSTFMTEMVETSIIVNEATNNSLVILDELGRGTSTEDGLAISRAVLEYIVTKIKCITLFATHYKQLCQLADNHKFIKLKTLKIKKWQDEVIFLYKVIDGVSEGSFGIHVAGMAGIKSVIIERSKKILVDINEKKLEKTPNIEKSEFNEEKENSKENFKEIKNIFNKIELDELSPKEALDILYAMKKNF